MNVLYDHQIFELQPFGGISRYFYELWRHAEKSGFAAHIATKYCKNTYLFEDDAFRHSVKDIKDPMEGFLFDVDFRGRNRLYLLKNKLLCINDKRKKQEENRLFTIREWREKRYDLFHPTYYHPYLLNELKDRPFVLTVFDMIHEIYPEYFSLDDEIHSNKKRLCDAASQIIVISEQTKKDLVAALHIDPQKVHVIHLASSLQPCAEPSDVLPFELSENYLLFVGHRKQYKNFYFFLSVIAPLLQESPSLKLVCTGKAFSKKELEFIAGLHIQDKIVLVTGDDRTLTYLYQHALAFVFPSLYEGFGMPVLEAFTCGCPAILSNSSSLREIGDAAAIYFDPKDAKSMQDAIAEVIGNEAVRDQLIGKGYERAKDFSWEKTVEKTCHVYQKALNA